VTSRHFEEKRNSSSIKERELVHPRDPIQFRMKERNKKRKKRKEKEKKRKEKKRKRKQDRKRPREGAPRHLF